MKTREKILLKAQELFNKKGFGQVSVRNICEELGISLGNFTYYFPDKQQIVVELYRKMIDELENLDKKIKIERECILYLLHYHKQVFVVETAYKFFYLNTTELINNNPAIREEYLKHLENEKERMLKLMNMYLANGVLRQDVDKALLDKMLNLNLMVSSFWMIDAEIRFPGKEKQKLLYYLELCCSILEPHLTEPALKEYKQFFSALRKK
ncbi:MAG TPA: TetR/AcrR family transcriptional regulator [Flavisolibacter sp.]|nr:TetR/AcrR family transcriptional regulator [Flavisolibacter sp.]